MKTINTLKHLILPAVLAASTFASVGAQAAVFDVSGQLTGDNRIGNPTGLVIDVDIAVNGNTASWLIDINSPDHTSIKMDEFYFNLAGVNAANVTALNFAPTDWGLTSPATTVGGGNFTPNFLFETTDGTGNPSNQPTNSVDFSFDLILSSGDWDIDNFLLAALSSSSDTVLGSGQMGAHLQSLNVNNDTCSQGGCSDSGFALGNYVNTGGDNNGNVPEPTSLLLIGTGLLGLFGTTRKKA